MGFTITAIALVVFAVSLLLTARLAKLGTRRFLIDHPNARSLHEQPTTRGGGLAVVSAVVVGVIGIVVLTTASQYSAWLAIGALMVAGISFVDDLSHVHPGIRISVHILAALILVYGGLVMDRLELPGLAMSLVPWAGVVLTCLYVGWLVNLYNFMDGMDGFAGGMAVIGFGTFAVLGLMSGQWQFASISLVVAAAAGGFLLFNFPPARIFMGDLGASLLGFLVAGLSLWASAADIFPIWVGVLIFSPFIVDASYTLARRLGRRERVWEAHKTHCYQRLVEHGWGHRKTVLWEYALMMLCALSAVAVMRLASGFQWVLLSTWVVTYAILIAFVNLVGRSPDTS